MKRSIFLTFLFVCAIQFSFFAQTAKRPLPPSDVATGYTYDFEKANDLILERISDPKTSNQDVKPIVEEQTFPKLKAGEKIDADYKKKVAVWIEKNPDLIITTLKNRKEIVLPF